MFRVRGLCQSSVRMYRPCAGATLSVSPVVPPQRRLFSSAKAGDAPIQCNCAPAASLAGTVQYYTRHVLVATSVPAADWPSHIEDVTKARDPSVLSLQLIHRMDAALKRVNKARLKQQSAGAPAAPTDGAVSRITAFDVSHQFTAATAAATGSSGDVIPSGAGGIRPASSAGGAVRGSGGLRFADGDVIVFPEALCIRRRGIIQPATSVAGSATVSDALMHSILFDKQIDLQLIPSGDMHKLPPRDRFVFVCTHAARDARCGTCGPPLLDSYRASVAAPPRPGFGYTYTFGVSHIGGHKYAPNAIAYPRGDWYGHVASAERLHALVTLQTPKAAAVSKEWRGGIGQSESQQKQHFSAAALSQ